MRWDRAAVICVLAASAGLGIFALPGAATAATPAYEQLSVEQLAETLRRMHMYELLDQLVAESKDVQSHAVRMIVVESKIARAATASPEQRDALLNEAVVELRKLLGQAGEGEKPGQTVKRYRLMLKLAVTQALTQGDPYALSVLFLQGEQADLAVLRALTAEPAKIIGELEEEIGETAMTWREDMRTWIVHGIALEALHEEVRYRAGWIHLYRGMAAATEKEKIGELRKAINSVHGFAVGDVESGVKYQSTLLIARAERLLGNHDRAVKHLRGAVGAEAGADVAYKARFELARNAIEHGRSLAQESKLLAAEGSKTQKEKQRNTQKDAPKKDREEDTPKDTRAEAKSKAQAAEKQFQKALTEIQSFQKEAARIKGSEGQVEVDLLSVLLKNYLYEARAAAETDKKAALKHSEQAQNVLLEFVDKHSAPEIQDAFYDLIANKYRGQTDYEKLPSMVVMALGSQKYLQAERGNDRELDLALRLLTIVRNRRDKAARRVHPQVLWRLAFLHNLRRDNLESGRMFRELAAKYPDHELAFEASRNAVQGLFGVFEERRREGKAIHADLRSDYIKAMEGYVNNKTWGTRPEVARWNFQLAEQYERSAAEAGGGKQAVAWYQKAAETYEKVPRGDQLESMQARQRALRSRTEVLTLGQAEAGARTEAAEKLVKQLTEFSSDARRAMAANKDEQARADLLRWGSEAELLAAELLYEELDRKARAMQLLESLPKNWPGATILSRSESFKIRKLVEQGDTSKAIAALDQFGKDHPAEAKELLPLVISQIEDRIEAYRGVENKKDLVASYQKNYYRLAQALFDREKGKPLKDRYAYTQTYANALLEAGRPEEAMKVLEECKAFDDARRTKRQQAIDEQFAPKLAAVANAAGDKAALAKERDAFYELLTSHGIERMSEADTTEVVNAWDYYGRAGKEDKPEMARRLATFHAALRKGLTWLRDRLKKRVPVEARNVMGLAKAHKGVGRLRERQRNDEEAVKAYKEGLKQYRKVLAGVDPDDQKQQKLFWTAQLGYCECVLGGYRRNKEAIQGLVARIRILRDKSPMMGGYYPRFNAIEKSAQQIVGR